MKIHDSVVLNSSHLSKVWRMMKNGPQTILTRVPTLHKVQSFVNVTRRQVLYYFRVGTNTYPVLPTMFIHLKSGNTDVPFSKDQVNFVSLP